MNEYVTKYKAILRKTVANLKRNMKRGTKAETLTKIAKLKSKLNTTVTAKQLIATIHSGEHDGKRRCADCIRLTAQMQAGLTFGKLITTLEKMLAEEEATYRSDAPTQTDLKRWALKSSVLDYYKNLKVDPQTEVVQDVTTATMVHALAPDTSIIYQVWLRKLGDLVKQTGVNQLDIKQLDRARERGIEQGGAFEKGLLRYREDFITRMINE